jgi:acyl-CoA synthetase (NDP forming)
MSVDLEQIRPIFEPRSVAILGASADNSKFGGRLTENLIKDGFTGRIYPVSRSETAIMGLKAYPTLADLPESPDLVLITIPAQATPRGIAEAVAVNARAAIVYGAGFAEAGPKGRELQEEIERHLHGSGLRMVGPNCLGVRNMHLPMNAATGAVPPVAGSISMLTQSGSFGNAAATAFRGMGVGFANYASIGNMVDITHAELIHWCGADKNTAVIMIFAEGIKDIDALLDAIGEVASRKPVVILKAGRSPLGQRASLSHTSSLGADGRVTDDLLREAGATVVRSMQELFDASAALALTKGRYPAGRNTAIFTVAGGPGVVAADHCFDEGLDLPPLDEKLAKWRPDLPPFASLSNPVDVTGQTKRSLFEPVFQATADEVDSIIAVALGLDIVEYGQAVVKVAKTKPVVCCMVSPNCEKLFAAEGVANFHSVERAVRSMRHLVDRGSINVGGQQRGIALPARPIPAGMHRETVSKEYLAAYGMSVTREREVTGLTDAVAVAHEIGYPVALKVSSDAIPHKSDHGGVVLGIGDESALCKAYQALQQRFPDAAVLVQEMVPGGLELIIGGHRSDVTGPVVMIGIGGVYAEVFDDVVFCRAPATTQSALAALNRLRAQKLLNGYRGAPAVSRSKVAEIAVTLSAILAGNPSIKEIDLNPVIVCADRAMIVDALIIAPQPKAGTAS